MAGLLISLVRSPRENVYKAVGCTVGPLPGTLRLLRALPGGPACPVSGSPPPHSVSAAGDHSGRLGGDHVLRHGRSFLLQLHLFYPAHHSKCQGSWGFLGQLKDPWTRDGVGGGVPRNPAEPGVLSGREQEGQFFKMSLLSDLYTQRGALAHNPEIRSLPEPAGLPRRGDF